MVDLKRTGRFPSMIGFDLDAAAMSRDGHLFHVSGNGVGLTAHVPPQYLNRTEA